MWIGHRKEIRKLPWSERFFLIFLRLRWESREAAIYVTILRVAKRRERKTSGYFGLESHFHADARVRIWPSGSDWLTFLQTGKSMWLVHSIGNTIGTVGISVTALFVISLADLYGGRKLCAKYFMAINPVCRPLLSLYSFKIRLCSIWIVFLKVTSKKFWSRYSNGVITGHQKKALHAVINRQGRIRHIANRTWKINYFSVAPRCLQISRGGVL